MQINSEISADDAHLLPKPRFQPTITAGTRFSRLDWYSHTCAHTFLAQQYEDDCASNSILQLYAGLVPGLDDPDYAPAWDESTRSLQIWPIDGSGFDYWLIQGKPQLLSDDNNRAIIYLYVKGSTRWAPGFTLQDSIFWLDQDHLYGHGCIDEVLQHDIIHTADGHLVPVLVELRSAEIGPLKIDDWVIEDNPEEYAARFSNDRLPHKNGCQSPQRARHMTKLPQIAAGLNYSLGLRIHEQLEYEIRDRAS